MFRLISLNIDDPNYLGHIPEGKLVFVPELEREETSLPYTTVLIGPNGTGKSTLLRYLEVIFEDIEYYKQNQKRRTGAINFPFSIKYKIDSDLFEICQLRPKLDKLNSKNGTIHFIKEYKASINNEPNEDLSNIKIPSRIIAVCYLAMDRFRQKKNETNDYYQYLGLRHRSNAASPAYFMNNTLPLLFDYITESRSVGFLKNILEFMEMNQDYLGIQLEYRYKQYFFKQDLTDFDFKELFEDYKKFSERKSTPFAVDYYKKHIADNPKLINKIVNYIKQRTIEDKIQTGSKNVLSFNLFDNYETVDELILIHHLQKLDLLASATLLFRKNSMQKDTTAQELSSGEFHFLTTMIAIQASIKDNSLILIDEPETSLHPNWQMKYANNLKNIFKRWNSSHFILATHSHFIVSDLEGESSSVIGLTGQIPKIKAEPLDYNTYGWSPDEVLYKVFGLRTTRNYFFEYDITQLAYLLNSNSTDFDKIKSIAEKLSKYKFSEEDPLNKLIKIALNYIDNKQC